MTKQTENQAKLTDEVFMKPSNEVKTERFTEQAQAAACSGECSSGICRTLV